MEPRIPGRLINIDDGTTTRVPSKRPKPPPYPPPPECLGATPKRMPRRRRLVRRPYKGVPEKDKSAMGWSGAALSEYWDTYWRIFDETIANAAKVQQ